jgi:hypothetical protein
LRDWEPSLTVGLLPRGASLQLPQNRPRQVEQVTNHLPLEKAFWTEQAERFLSDFIWNDGAVPPSGKLVLKGVEADELEKAAKEHSRKR